MAPGNMDSGCAPSSRPEPRTPEPRTPEPRTPEPRTPEPRTQEPSNNGIVQEKSLARRQEKFTPKTFSVFYDGSRALFRTVDIVDIRNRDNVNIDNLNYDKFIHLAERDLGTTLTDKDVFALLPDEAECNKPLPLTNNKRQWSGALEVFQGDTRCEFVVYDRPVRVRRGPRLWVYVGIIMGVLAPLLVVKHGPSRAVYDQCLDSVPKALAGWLRPYLEAVPTEEL
jgi:hypothetical protein